MSTNTDEPCTNKGIEVSVSQKIYTVLRINFGFHSLETIQEQLSIHGPTPFIPLEQRQRPGEKPGRPEEQLFGPAKPLYRPGEHPNRLGATPFIPLEQRQRPGEQPGRPHKLLFGPAEPLYISRDQLNKPQNDCKSLFLDNKGTRGTGTDVWDWIPRPPGS
ncbi:hypothetical protein C5167_027812 [Papaver somniferum]|nr:hypothetical protein C5167_027812 [Papaver somniferum]